MGQLEFNSGLDIPLGLLIGAKFTGYDELGNPVYRGSDGRSYAVPGGTPTNPTAGMGEAKDTGKKRGSVIKGLARDPIEGMKSIAKAIYGGTVDAVAMPGRAAAGEIVTMGDILNTAGMVQLGGAAMPAPKGALRSGAMREAATAAQSKADEVLQLLKSGRGAEVTDDMLAAADPQALWAGYDLPMDAASRAERARGMGFDTRKPVYHGSPDGRGVAASGFSARTQTVMQDGGKWVSDVPTPIFTADSRKVASTYANPSRAWDYQGAEPKVFELYRRQGTDATIDAQGARFRGLSGEDVASATGADLSQYRGQVRDSKVSTDGLGLILRDQGFDGAVIKNVVDDYIGNGKPTNVQLTTNPANLRATSARFDPRLAHLSNLNASNASPSVGAMTMAQILGEEEATRRTLASFFPR